jgi:Ca2+-binding EF-hand superfamily protein
LKALASCGEDLKTAFKKHDSDGSGDLDRKEFRAIFREANSNLSIDDIESLFDVLDTNGSGTISYSEFCGYLGGQAEYDLGPRKTEAYGSRPTGYTGHRRKQSYYDSVGKASSNMVSTAVKQIVAGKASSITSLFNQLDANGDGILQRKELRAGFDQMRLGLNATQIDAIYDELVKPSQDGLVRIGQLTAWLEGVDFVSVTLAASAEPESNSPLASPKTSFSGESAPLHNVINGDTSPLVKTRSGLANAGAIISKSPSPTKRFLGSSASSPSPDARRYHSSSQYRGQHQHLRLA